MSPLMELFTFLIYSVLGVGTLLMAIRKGWADSVFFLLLFAVLGVGGNLIFLRTEPPILVLLVGLASVVLAVAASVLAYRHRRQ